MSALPSTTRRLAERVGLVARRRAIAIQVPRLATGGPAGRPPTAWFITPDFDRPSGGARKEYRAVDVLNAAGLPAAVVHHRPGFACSWFDHETRVVSASDVRLGPRDVVVVPEVYWPSIRDLPAGIRQVVYNQNAYITLDSLADVGASALAPYLGNPDLAGVLAVSEENAELLRYLCPGVEITRVRHGLDASLHHPPALPPGRCLGLMPRRRAAEATQLLHLLRARGALHDWEVLFIDGLDEAGVASALRRCQVFIALSEREGFGLPPLEAMACGCLVVGFDGFAGREFLRPPFARPVPNGDVLSLARAVEAVLAEVEADPGAAMANGRAGSRFALETYSPEAERSDLVSAFGPLIGG